MRVVRQGFGSAGVPAELTDALVAAYDEAKRRFHLADHRPNAIEGGRFCEAAYRILEDAQSQTHTALGDPSFKTNVVTQKLEQDKSLDDTIRFHIPRALRVIYDVRNKRDAGHLGNGTVSPNLMDSMLVVAVMDWVMAEFVRLFHSVSVDDAQAIIEGIVTREVPVIEEIDGQPVCSAKLSVGDRALVFLYRAGQSPGLPIIELQRQMRHPHRGNLTATVKKLDTGNLVLLHPVTKMIQITAVGLKEVEARRLLHPSH
jgi:hypothetical protein